MSFMPDPFTSETIKGSPALNASKITIPNDSARF